MPFSISNLMKNAGLRYYESNTARFPDDAPEGTEIALMETPSETLSTASETILEYAFIEFRGSYGQVKSTGVALSPLEVQELSGGAELIQWSRLTVEMTGGFGNVTDERMGELERMRRRLEPRAARVFFDGELFGEANYPRTMVAFEVESRVGFEIVTDSNDTPTITHRQYNTPYTNSDNFEFLIEYMLSY